MELIGYIGSFLIGLSLTMSNIKKLRWINLFGASTFAFYGAMISSWPVLALNSFIVLTDIWYLYKMSRKDAFFSLLEIPEHPTPYLTRFLAFHQDELARIFPDFSLAEGGLEGWWFLRDMQPVGLFIFRREEASEGVVEIDYVTPAFRDMQTARWFFSEGLAHLEEKGVRAISARSMTPKHTSYLRKVGFAHEGDGRYRLAL